MVHDELDPVDERVAPFVLAVGRAVLGAAALEKVLLVDIAQRRGNSEGLHEALGEQLAQLERQPAGSLLHVLRGLGLPADLADRIEDVIRRRNQLVHRIMDDPDVAVAWATGQGIGDMVSRVDALAADAQRVVAEIAPPAFAGAEDALGVTLPTLLERAKSIDPDVVDDPVLREQLRSIGTYAGTIDPRELKFLRRETE